MYRLSLVLLLISWLNPSFAQVETNEHGIPFPEQQWKPQQLSTPFGVLNGWRTQMRSEGARYLLFWFEPTQQVVEVTFYLKTPPKGERGLSFGLSFGPPNWAHEAVRLAFGGNGWLSQRDIGDWFTWRSRFSWLPVTTFPFDTWIHVRLIADPSIGAFRVWLNERLAFPDLLPFSAPVPQVSCFFLFNGEGTGAFAEVSQPVIRVGTLPNAPRRLRVQPLSPSALQLSWEPPTEPVRAYRIYRRGNLVAELSSNQQKWVDTSLRTGEAYSYFVTAVSERGESLPSWSDAAMPLPPLPLVLHPSSRRAQYDVIVVGATPAGIAAAITAARMRRYVALIERTNHIGGMMTGGLSATDRRYRQASGGLFAEFVQCVNNFYAQAYGKNSPQSRACRDGYLFEPKVALQVFHHLLSKEAPYLHLYLHQELGGVLKEDHRLIALLLYDRQRKLRWQIRGRIFLDATYEGDLAAKAGVPYRVGREGRDEFGEEFAGEVFWDTAKMHLPPEQRLSFGRPEGDRKVQAYNYRLTLTKRTDNRASLSAPSDYAPERFVEIRKRVQEKVLGHPMEVVSLVKLPQQKFDANNTPGPFPSTDFIGANYEYPEGDWPKREAIARAHRNYILGLLYFLQTDPKLPNEFRVAAQHWSLAADEFVENDNFPPQLYVREARRIVGEYTFTEHDARSFRSGHRSPVHEDSIAVAEYPIDSHATTPRDPQNPYLHEGFFYLPGVTVPSHVPYRIMLPRSPIENLLVCGAVSATHVGFGTLRLEPVWMALGQAAGVASYLALEKGVPLRRVPVDELQKLLLEQGQVIAFFHDLPPPGSAAFAAVQFFAVRGFFDTYEAQLNRLVDEEMAQRMLHRLATLLKRPIPAAFGTAHKHPTQSDIARWLAAFLQVPEREIDRYISLSAPEKPLTIGQLCEWLYRLWWMLR